MKQIYNAVGYNTSSTNGNHIGITGYLEQYANKDDLQLFYKDQRPDAVGSSFNFVSIKGIKLSCFFFSSSIVLSSSLGGLNNQSQAAAGDEADLDVQFAFGITYPTNSTFFSTGGRPPYIPDFSEPDQNFNEPYEDVSTLAILVAVLFLTYFPSGSTTCCGILTPLKRSQPVMMTMNRPSHLPMLNVLVKALRNSVGKFHIPIQSDA